MFRNLLGAAKGALIRAAAVDYNALLSLSRGSILTEVVLFWGLFLESIFLF